VGVICIVNISFSAILYFFNTSPEQTAIFLNSIKWIMWLVNIDRANRDFGFRNAIWCFASCVQAWYFVYMMRDDTARIFIEIMNANKNFGMVNLSHALRIFLPVKNLSLTEKAILLAFFTTIYQNGWIFLCFLLFLF
jgi:hypothetical protein